jgi:glycerophosphoryl diester phosphodiesterase
MPNPLEPLFHRLVDGWFASRPRRRPPPDLLQRCRLIAHRGEHDNRTVFENTLTALEASRAAGIWGIEFDVRWTRDLQPVVCHDETLQRVFGIDLRLQSASLTELQKAEPRVPTLAEVIQRFGGRLHLMIEIKKEPYADPARQNDCMEGLLSDLAPGSDYHLLSLDPEMFAHLTFAPPATKLPIARLQVPAFSRLSLQRRWGGLLGHYLFVSAGRIYRHHAADQQIGTGFVDSPACLFREIERGVDWIFSNRAARLQALCRRPEQIHPQ